MAVAAEQKIFDWHTENAGYSGEMAEQASGATRLAQDIAAVAQRASHSKPLVDSNSSSVSAQEQARLATTLVDNGEHALDVSAYSERVGLRPQKIIGSSLAPLKEWEGFVEHIGDRTFFVKICDVKDPSGIPSDEAEFELRDLPESDRRNLRIGSIIRWVIGYERLPTDQRQKVSRVHVRRLPVFTTSDLVSAYNEADRLLAGLLVDGSS